MALDNNWFTEIHADCGSAFSLELGAKIHEEQTPYQLLAIYETAQWGNLMTLDGLVMLTTRDNFLYHEMMTHPALLTHPDPKRVLIIGGGDCGTLREVLKHPGMEQVVQAELDERVTRVSEQYFPELCESNNDSRAQLEFVDGIKWVEDAEPGDYDIIIIDSTDPIGQAARLFSAEFYNDCNKALSGQGILIAQSESPLLHADIIKSMRRNMMEAGFGNLATLCFPQPVYPSGWWSSTMALKNGSASNFRRIDAASLNNKYYTSALHEGLLELPPFLRAAIDT
ncbi:MAG: polyamine aminopropyltransferase [Proteobacteria bacterium]|nr:polyamine aminopropyltransferase [Pseudomonadota bacterium]